VVVPAQSSIADRARRPTSPRSVRRALALNPSGALGVLIVTAVVLAAVFAQWVSPFDPLAQDINQRLKPPLWAEPGTAPHLLGTDELGRDVLGRLIFGARVSLVVALCSVPLSALLGSVVGLTSGYHLGLVDEVLMRVVDIQLAVPFILLVLAVMAVLGPSLRNLIVVLAATTWVHFAKLVRGEVLTLRQREFVVAARAAGATTARVVRGHVLPNVIPTIIVLTTLYVPRMIIAEASLSFLGLGIQPPTPSWGGMLSEGREYIWTAWWASTFPGVAISVTVLGANLMGDWLRDALDPHLRH